MRANQQLYIEINGLSCFLSSLCSAGFWYFGVIGAHASLDMNLEVWCGVVWCLFCIRENIHMEKLVTEIRVP